MPAVPVFVRLLNAYRVVSLSGALIGAGEDAASAFQQASAREGVALLLTGDRDYAVQLSGPSQEQLTLLRAREGKGVFLSFPGRGTVRRVLAKLSVQAAQPTTPTQPERPVEAGPALDLTEGREGAAPLWLLSSGRFSSSPAGAEGAGEGYRALITAARWVSTRRKTAFESLFPPSAFHPDLPRRAERLSVDQARGTMAQVSEALAYAAPGGAAAASDATQAAQIRSACATILSHVVATALHDPGFRAPADEAARALFAMVDAEQGAKARPALRAHIIGLLQMRAPALGASDRDRARVLVQSLVRAAPPYAELRGPWSFAMCSADEFHEGECDILVEKFRFREIDKPADAPSAPSSWRSYRVFEAPFKSVHGQPIRVFARSAQPTDENHEMGSEYFTGVLINRHAQLGSFDMRASSVSVQQRGYKLMMNSQCAGLTTRFAIGRMFPDADIYSSWDSTYFRKDFEGHKVIASEGLDCFYALLEGMSRGEDHASLDRRMRRVQWRHPQATAVADFSQFVGPAHPLVVARFSDVNQDGRADLYDGFMDFELKAIAEDIHAAMTPRDPGVSATQVSGEAANGLGWAAGSMNRVTQYSDIWAGLPGESEGLYAFHAGGFYSHREPPRDVHAGSGDRRDPGRLPAIVRYEQGGDASALRAEVLMHAWLSHAPKELKRLLVAADAMTRALDLGILKGDSRLLSPEGRRGAVLLTLAGLLEFPADQNRLDGLWSAALQALGFPEISRSVVRACITDADHDMSNYYGSIRGLGQLLDSVKRSDPVAWAKLSSADAAVGRAAELVL